MGAITDARAEKLSIGDLSELTGVNIETIRYYERVKMVPAPPRTPGWPSRLRANPPSPFGLYTSVA